MKFLNIVLPDPTYNIISELAQKNGVDAAHYCSALLSELAETDVSEAPRPEKDAEAPKDGQITEVDLMREIFAYLTHRGGVAPKVAVEQAVFEKYKNLFKNSYYTELVGGGVPRWQKNVQFARNTAKNMGLIKPPEESGRGFWELTEKGRLWKFDSK
jgi:hypothetical protein